MSTEELEFWEKMNMHLSLLHTSAINLDVGFKRINNAPDNVKRIHFVIIDLIAKIDEMIDDETIGCLE